MLARLCLIVVLVAESTALRGAELPSEPIRIATDPQFLFDRWVVDNHWALRYKRQAVVRVFHQAVTNPPQPVMARDNPSFVWVIRDETADRFLMYYQANFRIDKAPARGRKFKTRIACAVSRDGIRWTHPQIQTSTGSDSTLPRHVAISTPEHPDAESCGPCVLEVPESDRRGFRYLMLYRAKGRGGRDFNGLRVIGSNDGLHWDPASDTRIAHLHSDHHNTISWDPARREYVMFCRGKHIYRAFGDTMLDTGASRRVARLASRSLWTDWLSEREPQTVLVPDEIDSRTHFNFFYGMPVRYRYGIYWGFLEPFRMNDFIQTELAVSRDGFHFQRFADRKPIVPYGKTGMWNDEMIFVSPSWVEVGDEWWLYYSGWDGPHGTPDRNGAIGLARIRREGFVSLRGPAGGGVVCTRTLIWPGGELLINCDSAKGVARVRVSDARRKPIAGFDYTDCNDFTGDSVRHAVRWSERSLDQLKGKAIRLEFFLQNADLYTFRATGAGDSEHAE